MFLKIFFIFNYFELGGVGILMIQLAENQVPHHELQPMVAMRQVVRSNSPKFTNEDKWSSEMKDLLAKCVEKKPVERYTSESLLSVRCFVIDKFLF